MHIIKLLLIIGFLFIFENSCTHIGVEKQGQDFELKGFQTESESRVFGFIGLKQGVDSYYTIAYCNKPAYLEILQGKESSDYTADDLFSNGLCNLDSMILDADGADRMMTILRADARLMIDESKSFRDNTLNSFLSERVRSINFSNPVKMTISSVVFEITEHGTYTVGERRYLQILFYLKALMGYARQHKDVENYSSKLERTLVYDRGLVPLLYSKCVDYLPEAVSNSIALVVIHPDYRACTKAAEKFVELLDPVYLGFTSASYGYTVYNDDMLKLMSEKSTEDYLKAIAMDIREKQLGFNLNEFTFRYFNDPKVALKYLTLVFQNIGFISNVFYLLYADIPADKEVQYTRNLRLLSEFNNFFGNYRFLTRQPNLIDIDRHSERVYHYTTPRYMADRLMHEGIARKWALFIPMMFNTVYEYILEINNINLTAEELAKFNEMLGESPKPYQIFYVKRLVEFYQLMKVKNITKDPSAKRMETVDAGTMEDLYLGYAGAMWGIAAGNDVLPASEFVEQFSAGPREFILNLINQF